MLIEVFFDCLEEVISVIEVQFKCSSKEKIQRNCYFETSRAFIVTLQRACKCSLCLFVLIYPFSAKSIFYKTLFLISTSKSSHHKG